MTKFFESLNYDGTATATVQCFDLSVSVEPDECARLPWQECEGHGPVSDWRNVSSKRPGEMILVRDRDSARFYDFAEACRIARRDKWNAPPYDIPGETPRQQAARAAMSDFNRLRDWCNDRWHYCFVSVTISRNGIKLATESIGGLESDDESGQLEYANECAAMAIEAARKAIASLIETE